MCDVLMIDSDCAHAQRFAHLAAQEQVEVCVSRAFGSAISICGAQKPRVILLDATLLGRNRDREIFALRDQALLVLMGEGNGGQDLLQWMALGVCEYVTKPVEVCRVKRLLTEFQASRSLAVKCAPDASEPVAEMIVGECPGMMLAMKTAGLVARTDAALLIRGESGTGKELLAREVHRASGRSGPFVPLNCAAVSEGIAESELFGHERGAFTGAVTQRAGCFEQADGGTLFLDEIGDAAPGFQAKLLRALDRGEFFRVGGQTLVHSDVRIVAATNRDLEALVEAGSFRLDLLYRLGAVTLTLPPLRERREDIPTIVRMMLMRLNQRLGRRIRGMTRDALERLLHHRWPGNLREMQHVIHRAVLTCRGHVILAAHLTDGSDEGESSGHVASIQTLAEVEQAHIGHILDITGGNRGRACQLLGISRPTLRRKIERYRLEHPLARAAQVRA